jgi:hypothetical protein
MLSSPGHLYDRTYEVRRSEETLMRFRSYFLALLLLGALVVVQPSYGGAIITTGATALGVNDEGHLNILIPPPVGFSFPSGSLGDNGGWP